MSHFKTKVGIGFLVSFFEDGSAFTWRRNGNFIWRNMNEYEIAASERGQFKMLTQVERVERSKYVDI